MIAPAATEPRTRTVRGAGVDLAVCERGDPASPTFVLVHGYPDTKEMWDETARELARHSHVVTYDVRGAGASTPPADDDAGWDLDRLEDDVLAVIDACAPGKRVHLVGHDWGSIQGWRFATSTRVAPRLLSFASMSGPCLDHIGCWMRERPKGITPLLRQAVRSWYVGAMMVPGLPTVAWTSFSPLWPRVLRRELEREPAAAPLRGYPGASVARDGRRGVGLYRRNIPRTLASPRPDATALVPVLLVVAEHDPYVTPAMAEHAERFTPVLRRRDVAAGHWLPRSHPALVASLVAEHARDVERGAVRPGLDRRRVPLRHGQLVLVTGAGSGIGRAISFALAEQGVRLIAVDLDLAAAERTVALARDLGAPEARALRVDVSDHDAMQALARTVEAEHGALDVLVNNAGIAVAGPLLDTTVAEWRRLLDVNLMGVIHGCHLLAPAMVARGRGSIVNVASAAAFLPSTSLPAYCTSKAAVLMFSEGLRAELAPAGVKVTALCPGIVNTNITRSARFAGRGEADEQRMRAATVRLYERRDFGPERVADAVMATLDEGPAVLPVTPEAHLLRAIGRLGPTRLRQAVASLDALGQ